MLKRYDDIIGKNSEILHKSKHKKGEDSSHLNICQKASIKINKSINKNKKKNRVFSESSSPEQSIEAAPETNEQYNLLILKGHDFPVHVSEAGKYLGESHLPYFTFNFSPSRKVVV